MGPHPYVLHRSNVVYVPRRGDAAVVIGCWWGPFERRLSVWRGYMYACMCAAHMTGTLFSLSFIQPALPVIK